jgi:hypothetical protein
MSALATVLLVCVSLGQVENHVLNTGVINSESYVWTQQPDGTLSYVPIINGNLPVITGHRDATGKIVYLDCDYSKPIPYDPSSLVNGVVKYVPAKKVLTPVAVLPAPVPPKRPAPRSTDPVGSVGRKLDNPIPPTIREKAPAPRPPDMLRPSEVGDEGKVVLPRY